MENLTKLILANPIENLTKIILTKLETRKDARYPQEDKYPSKSTVIEGYTNETYYPKEDTVFYILSGVGIPFFHTSIIESIEKKEDNLLILTTLNSIYELKIL